MSKREKSGKLFSFGMAGVALTAMIVAGLAANHPADRGASVQVRALAPVTFKDMERPDPVLLLTPVRLPDHRLMTR